MIGVQGNEAARVHTRRVMPPHLLARQMSICFWLICRRYEITCARICLPHM